RRRQYQYDARRQQGDGGGVFGDSQFTSTLSVNFHFPKIPRRTIKKRAHLSGGRVVFYLSCLPAPQVNGG
ncbi:hypothetical protein, partial [Aeromonas sp. ASNIH6]|uniref:hypothetical protein n=1 Tax=Aeromonas sp. ASNIH6 TaxID=1758188 RepID=UPI001CA4D1F1